MDLDSESRYVRRLIARERDLADWRSVVDASDVKAMVAALTYILSNAAKYDLDLETLFMELQQMGMPKGTYRSASTACQTSRARDSERQRDPPQTHSRLLYVCRALHRHVEAVHRT